MKKILNLICLIIFFTFLFNVHSLTANADTDDMPTLDIDELSMVVDTEYKLSVYNVPVKSKIYYKSTNPDIATINKKGIITSKKIGNTIINVTIKKDKKVTNLSLPVYVGAKTISIKMIDSTVILKKGDKTKLEVILKPINSAETPLFYSASNEIIKISEDGIIEAISEGKTNVYAYIPSNEDLYDICEITVK